MFREIKISTYIAPLTRLGTPEAVVDVLKASGFDYYDFTMMYPILGFELFYNSEDYIQKAKDFKQHADTIGIHCNQTHGSVPCFRKNATFEENQVLFQDVKRCIEITHILGGKYCVFHPVSDCSMEDNIIFFRSIENIAKENNVIVAIENTLSSRLFGKPDDFVQLFASLNNDCFKMCLDIGHAETRNASSSAVEFINKLGNKIVCLHIHDNDKNSDLHHLPFTYSIDFNEIFIALKKARYKGDITFECGSYFNNMPISLFPDALKMLHSIGEYMGNQIFNLFPND